MWNLFHFLKKWPFGDPDTGDSFEEKLSFFKMFFLLYSFLLVSAI